MPTEADADLQRAIEALARNDMEGAGQALRWVLERDAGCSMALNLLGFIALRRGDALAAESLFSDALAHSPDNPVFLQNLGLACMALRRPADASAAFRRSLAAKPDDVDVWLRLCDAEQAVRGLDGVPPLALEALTYCPEDPRLLLRLANALHATGRYAEAIVHYQHVVRVVPTSVEARLDLAGAWDAVGRLRFCEEQVEAALSMQPDNPRARQQMGDVRYRQRRFREAGEQYAQAIRLAPGDARPINNLGMNCMAQGRVAEAIESFRRVLALEPDHATARSNLMLAMQYADTFTAKDILAEARRFAARFDGQQPTIAPREVSSGSRLRVGLVSADFRRHVVGLFLMPVLEHLSAHVEIVCYSDVVSPDPFTERIRSSVAAWVNAVGMDTATLARRIRADGIDVLIDLAGHTADNRLPVFALTPAPVRATWLGYPGTLGLPAIRYRFTDAVLDPPGEEHLSTETPLRLSTGYLCYVPPPEWGGALPVGALPALERGHVTFGAFNNFAKVSPSCLDAWAAVLDAVAGSRLVARAKPFDVAEAADAFKAELRMRGIAAERVDALPYLPDPARHLQVYDEVDIHLDSLPYAGGTTTCDALWMGVPVVTLAGDRPAARLGASVLTQVGCTEWIAASATAYVERAVSLASDLAQLARVRSGLRARVQASPLYDPCAHGAELAAAIRAAWETASRRTGDG